MKFKSVSLIAILSIFMLSCVDDLSNMGSQIQPASDKILVDTANFQIESQNYFVDSIVSRPDSMMLGSFYDLTYGTVNADIFTQLQPPLDFKYPAASADHPNFVIKADSAKVLMYLNSYFGDKNSPMEVNIYEMNKGKTFDFSTPYFSSINPNDYINPLNKVKIGSEVFDATTAAASGAVEFKLTDGFLNKFKRVLTDPPYTKDNESNFHNVFNGIYITTDFGSASMLYVRGFNLKFYFHYEFTSNNKTEIVKGNVSYPANQEVRQVNRFFHPNKEIVKQKLNSDPEINYISAPANVFTKVSVPLKKMKTRMTVGTKKLLINRAVLNIDIADVKDSSLAQPLISNVMLIKESAYNEFFKKRGLPSDTSAVVGKIAYKYNKTTKAYDYYYSFDLANIVTSEFNKPKFNENINFILVPITLKTNGSKVTTSYNHQNLMGAVKICSGKHKTKPMKIEMVYSGF